MIIPKKRNSVQLSPHVLKIRSPRHLRTTVRVETEDEVNQQSVFKEILREVFERVFLMVEENRLWREECGEIAKSICQLVGGEQGRIQGPGLENSGQQRLGISLDTQPLNTQTLPLSKPKPPIPTTQPKLPLAPHRLSITNLKTEIEKPQPTQQFLIPLSEKYSADPEELSEMRRQWNRKAIINQNNLMKKGQQGGHTGHTGQTLQQQAKQKIKEQRPVQKQYTFDYNGKIIQQRQRRDHPHQHSSVHYAIADCDPLKSKMQVEVLSRDRSFIQDKYKNYIKDMKKQYSTLKKAPPKVIPNHGVLVYPFGSTRQQYIHKTHPESMNVSNRHSLHTTDTKQKYQKPHNTTVRYTIRDLSSVPSKSVHSRLGSIHLNEVIDVTNIREMFRVTTTRFPTEEARKNRKGEEEQIKCLEDLGVKFPRLAV